VRREGKKLARAAALHASGQLRFNHPGSGHDPNRDDDADYRATLAALGLQPDDDDAAADDAAGDGAFYLWPECLDTFEHWRQLQTQWRVGGMGGVTGLDYAGVSAYLALCGPRSAKERKALFMELRVMEASALDAMARERERGG